MSAMSLFPLAIIILGYGFVFSVPWHEPPAKSSVNGGDTNNVRQRAKRHLNIALGNTRALASADRRPRRSQPRPQQPPKASEEPAPGFAQGHPQQHTRPRALPIPAA